jgi:hypothetical protein
MKLRSITGVTFVVAALCTSIGTACKSTTMRGGDDQSVTATTPRSMTIRRGETTDLKVAIDRKNTNGAVKVSISQLPAGVEAEPSSMKVESTVATFILKATSAAPIVSHQQIAITIEDGDGHQAMQYIELNVAA